MKRDLLSIVSVSCALAIFVSSCNAPVQSVMDENSPLDNVTNSSEPSTEPDPNPGEYKPHEQEEPLGGDPGEEPETDNSSTETQAGDPDQNEDNEGEYKPHIQEAPLTGEPGAEPEKDIMVTFPIPEEDQAQYPPGLPPGTFLATVDDVTFACDIWSGAPDRIYCIGPLMQNNVMALVSLKHVPSGTILYEGKLSLLLPEETEERPADQSCSGLDQASCVARADCKWSISSFPPCTSK